MLSFATIEASSPDATTVATFVPAAGMVCCSLTVGGEERLSQRRGLDAYASAGSTMGLPLLYPWANRLGAHEYATAGHRVVLPHDPARVHEEASGLPLHGLTPATMRWRARSAGGDRVIAELDFTDPVLLELFPFAHRVSLEAEVGPASLRITTTVRADAGARVPVSFGFHPYLRLTGAERAEWEVELPPCRGLVLDDRQLPTGERTPVAGGSVRLAEHAFDDAYELTGSRATFVARAPERELEVELLEGYGFAQVFSPPGAEFACFEPMTAPADALRSGEGLRVLEPGEEHRASFRIAVSA